MNNNLRLSILDLCPILEGETAKEAFSYMTELAQKADELSYERYWVAEHHDMLGIGSSAPEVLISHIASHTKSIRVGSGGIMLPNHSTYHMAEVFRTLETLYPGRIDLGLGRAPGSGSAATHALRRGMSLSADNFPKEVEDLIHYFKDELPLKAIPMNEKMPEMWMLGSSDFGARLAASMGLPYAFAQHFSGLDPVGVLNLYKNSFRPSEFLQKSESLMACHIICAETDEEADELALSSDYSFLLFMQNGRGRPFPKVETAKRAGMSQMDRMQVRASFPKFVGSVESIQNQLAPYREAGVDHFMVTSMIYDQKARQKSYELIKKI